MTRVDRELTADHGLLVSELTKSFSFGATSFLALDRLDLRVDPGQFVTVIGPSGCGKSTLLRIIAGLVPFERGSVSIFGESVDVAVDHKHIGFVPQSPALLPWRSVLENVRLPSQVNRKANIPTRRDPVEILEAFGLGDALYMLPGELSGGMQQRVAIARAFSIAPAVLLMDEPFSALDELTRDVLRHELLTLWESDHTTVVFVTHSVVEAVLLSDVVVVMSKSPGRVETVVSIDLPRPRAGDVEFTDTFHRLEDNIRLALRKGWTSGSA